MGLRKLNCKRPICESLFCSIVWSNCCSSLWFSHNVPWHLFRIRTTAHSFASFLVQLKSCLNWHYPVNSTLTTATWTVLLEGSQIRRAQLPKCEKKENRFFKSVAFIKNIFLLTRTRHYTYFWIKIWLILLWFRSQLEAFWSSVWTFQAVHPSFSFTTTTLLINKLLNNV